MMAGSWITIMLHLSIFIHTFTCKGKCSVLLKKQESMIGMILILEENRAKKTKPSKHELQLDD